MLRWRSTSRASTRSSTHWLAKATKRYAAVCKDTALSQGCMAAYGLLETSHFIISSENRYRTVGPGMNKLKFWVLELQRRTA